MPERTEYLTMMAMREAKQQTQHVYTLRAEMPRLMDVTTKAQMVLDHPGWQQYADGIESRVTAIEKARTAKTHTMIFGKAMGHDLELLKIELNTMDAEIAGLRYALSLIPEAIDAGVNARAAAASADH